MISYIGKSQNLPSLPSPLKHSIDFRLADDTLSQRKRYEDIIDNMFVNPNFQTVRFRRTHVIYLNTDERYK